MFTIVIDDHEYGVPIAHMDVRSPEFSVVLADEFSERYPGDIVPRDQLLVQILRMQLERVKTRTCEAADSPMQSLIWRDIVSVVGSPSPQFTTTSINNNAHEISIVYPLSLIVETRIISSIHQHILEEGNDLFQSIFGENMAHEEGKLPTLSCVHAAIQAAAVELDDRNRTSLKHSGQSEARLIMDAYLEHCLVPLLIQKGLIPWAVIALDTAMHSIGSSSSHHYLKKHAATVHRWFRTATRTVSLSSQTVHPPTHPLDSTTPSARTNVGSNSKEKQTLRAISPSFSYLSPSTADTPLESNSVATGRKTLFIAPLHSPTKFTTGLFIDDSETLKERLHYTSLPSPPSSQKSCKYELQMMGREIDRSTDRCRKLTERALLPRSPSSLPSSSSPTSPTYYKSPTSFKSPSSSSSPVHPLPPASINLNHIEVEPFLTLMRGKGVVPDLLDALRARQVFCEVSQWNRHHAELLYSVFSTDGSASLVEEAAVIAVVEATPSWDKSDVLNSLPERGFLLVLAAIAVLCFPGASLETGFQRLMEMDGDGDSVLGGDLLKTASICSQPKKR